MSETAENVQDAAEGANTEKYLIFSIMEKRYTFPSRIIGEITLFDTVYPLPLMPAYVLGAINRYSIPYALFDIGLLLFNTPSPHSKVLVLKDSIDRIAFLIDDVCGIADVPQDKLLNIERGAESGELADVLSGSFHWEDDDVFILDIQRVLARISDGVR